MIVTKYCSYVNVFQGCGEINLPKPEGIAAKWFFIKAGCGNTSPAATVPFGAMSVSPFSGGYPTGYLNHLPNSHSHPPKFEEGKKLLGFAHLQQSGTGAIGYYYNYAVVSPRNTDSEERRAPQKEYAEPGYYSCYLDDIFCELTASKNVAFHRYTFARENGCLNVDLSNNGLNIPGQTRKTAEVKRVQRVNQHTLAVELFAEGISLWFAFSSNAFYAQNQNKLVFFMPFGKKDSFVLRVSSSLVSAEHALSFLSEIKSFEDAKKQASVLWEQELSKIQIETKDKKILEIFYSNLYHSLVKPADRKDESFFYKGGEFLTDLATLWDMYKTGFPLIFMMNREMGEKTAESLMRQCESLGYIPNSVCLTDDFVSHSGQAKMLGDYVLLTAYRYGVHMDKNRLLKVLEQDAFSEDKQDFLRDNKLNSFSRYLDMTEAYGLMEQLARELGNIDLADRLHPLYERWEQAYDKATGLLRADSEYYEGTLYNYSFRQMLDMDARMSLAGGKEQFVSLLDEFFGYHATKDVVLPTNPFDYKPVEQGIQLHRFEGFNNESDTEAPFSYIYANRHDRTCEIIRAGMKYMFTTGRGGLPGNNDTGALSSYYVFMALGLFPVAGQDFFFIGSPLIDKAKFMLYNGKVLKIKVNGNSDRNIYVKKVSFNGEEIKDYRIDAETLLGGGTLELTMCDKSNRS